MLDVWNFQFKNSKIYKNKPQKSVITDELKLYHTKYISSKSNTKLSNYRSKERDQRLTRICYEKILLLKFFKKYLLTRCLLDGKQFSIKLLTNIKYDSNKSNYKKCKVRNSCHGRNI